MTAPVGAITTVEAMLGGTLSNCAAFQTFVGAADAAEALLRIHYAALPAPADGQQYTAAELAALRPFALIWTSEREGFERRRIAVGTDGFEFGESGRLQLELVRTVPTLGADEPALVEREFLNAIGQIIDNLCTLAGQGGYLAIERLSLDEAWRTHPDLANEIGDETGARLAAQWR